MKAKVLLVDDEPDFIQLMQFTLVCRGFDVLCAANGEEALDQARRALPDVVLLDLMLPDIDGFSVCEILRSQPSTAGVPVILVSALDGFAARTRGLEAGATCYFKKPVDLQVLSDSIGLAFERRQRQVSLRLVQGGCDGD